MNPQEGALRPHTPAHPITQNNILGTNHEKRESEIFNCEILSREILTGKFSRATKVWNHVKSN